MKRAVHSLSSESDGFRERFAEFIDGFTRIEDHPKLFPKQCPLCGQVFGTYEEYVRLTLPVKYVMEDCSSVMQRPYTMQYQNCRCGTTLILVLTEDIYPTLDRLWEALRAEAEQRDLPLTVVVTHFYEECAKSLSLNHLSRTVQERASLDSPERLPRPSHSPETFPSRAGSFSGLKRLLRGIRAWFA